MSSCYNPNERLSHLQARPDSKDPLQTQTDLQPIHLSILLSVHSASPLLLSFTLDSRLRLDCVLSERPVKAFCLGLLRMLSTVAPCVTHEGPGGPGETTERPPSCYPPIHCSLAERGEQECIPPQLTVMVPLSFNDSLFSIRFLCSNSESLFADKFCAAIWGRAFSGRKRWHPSP